MFNLIWHKVGLDHLIHFGCVFFAKGDEWWKRNFQHHKHIAWVNNFDFYNSLRPYTTLLLVILRCHGAVAFKFGCHNDFISLCQLLIHKYILYIIFIPCGIYIQQYRKPCYNISDMHITSPFVQYLCCTCIT